MRKPNKILIIFIIISALALGVEVKMNQYFIRQAKIESIRNEYKIKHLTYVQPKQTTTIPVEEKDNGILYTEKDRNKTVKIYAEKSGILYLNLWEYSIVEKDVMGGEIKAPTWRLENDQGRLQKTITDDARFGYMYMMPVSKGEEYSLKILSKAQNLRMKAYILDANVTSMNKSGTYLQKGTGKKDTKIIEQKKNDIFDFRVFAVSNSKNEKIHIKIMKQQNRDWIRKDEAEISADKTYNGPNLGKGKYKIEIQASNNMIYEAQMVGLNN